MNHSSFAHKRNNNLNNGRKKIMKKLTVSMAAIVVALVAFATPASAGVPCNQCGQYSTPAEIRTCMASCDKAPPAATTPPPAKTAAPPAKTAAPPAKTAAPPPPPPGCGQNEALENGKCVCTAGFEKIGSCGPCVAKCGENQARKSDNTCVDIGRGTCEPTCEAVERIERKISGTPDYFWWLLVITVIGLSNFGCLIALLVRTRKPGAPKPKPAKVPVEPVIDDPSPDLAAAFPSLRHADARLKGPTTRAAEAETKVSTVHPPFPGGTKVPWGNDPDDELDEEPPAPAPKRRPPPKDDL